MMNNKVPRAGVGGLSGAGRSAIATDLLPFYEGKEHLSMRKYPVCADCLEEIDPVRYDDCEKYYLTEKGEPLCRDCFIKREKKFLELSTDDYADLIGVRVVAL